jgi:hypothetical protein
MEEIKIACPYCGEVINVLVDNSVAEQQYYEDCNVCCCPILFITSLDEPGNIKVTVKTDNE